MRIGMRRTAFLATALLGALSLDVTVLGARAARAAGEVTVKLAFEKYKLDNGLEVVLHEDRRTPVVAINIWYHVGSKDEPKGKNGFAHLFEHVMFQGSRHVGEDMFFKYLERVGVSDRNGTTNTDRTNYFETVPSNTLETALWLESDRMAFLLDHADEATFKSQRDVVKNERRQNYENAPYGLVPQFVRAALFPESHPYHLLTIGSPEDLDAATLDDVRTFFRTFYVPNNATLVIAGDFDTAKTKALVAKYFAPIVRGANPPVKVTPVPVLLSAEMRLAVEAGVELPRVLISWPTPPQFTPDDAQLDLIADVLTSGKSSRLYKRLVYDLQIAQDIGAYQASGQLASHFEIQCTLKKGKKPEEAIPLIDAELAKLRAGPPTDDEVTRAKAGIVSQLVFGLERVTGRADRLNAYNQLAGDPGAGERDLERYQRPSAADLQATARTWLPEHKRVVTIVTPNPAAPRAGRLVSSKEVTP